MKFRWLKAEKRIKYFRTYFHFSYLSFGGLKKLKLKDIKSDSIYWLIDLSSEFILNEVLHSMRVQRNLGVGYDSFFFYLKMLLRSHFDIHGYTLIIRLFCNLHISLFFHSVFVRWVEISLGCIVYEVPCENCGRLRSGPVSFSLGNFPYLKQNFDPSSPMHCCNTGKKKQILLSNTLKSNKN